MKRAPDPWHWWLLALGKTAEWLIAYANQPGEATGAQVDVQQEAAASPPPQQEQDDNG